MALTRRQKQVLDFLVDFINKRGYSPSFEEIGKGMGLSSLATVLGKLEFPLLGRIAAGRPVEAISSPETISLADFANGKSGVYVLKVKGDSMVEDHICDGDFILVEGVETAENGEIVVALTGGTDATLKRFYRESNGRIRLQPANSQMEALILPARDVKIQGRVIGVLRKY